MLLVAVVLGVISPGCALNATLILLFTRLEMLMTM
jgi:hypothetical protein